MMESAPSAPEVRRLFDANAATYDRVNTVISLGLDSRWRRWAARRAVRRHGARVLDAFSGTGRTGVLAAELGAEVTLADFSRPMLAEAMAEARRKGVSVSVFATDLTGAEQIPGAPFDAVTVTFGIRYLADPVAVIARLASMLVPGGRVVLLEFAEPGHGLVSRAAGAYFFRLLPRIAAAIAGSPDLYEVLTSTTHQVRGAEHLEQLMRSAGLDIVGTKTMGFGLVVGVVGTAPPSDGEDSTHGCGPVSCQLRTWQE